MFLFISVRDVFTYTDHISKFLDASDFTEIVLVLFVEEVAFAINFQSYTGVRAVSTSN